MPDEKYTRCPGCATVFRVTPEQLAMHGGQVRCGHCKTVFDGLAQQVSLATPQRSNLASTTSAQPSAAPSTTSAASIGIDGLPDIVAEEESTEPGVTAAQVATADRFAPPAQRKRGHARVIAGSFALLLLLLLLAAQVLFHYRELIAAHFPAARPVLSGLCGFAGCSIGPLRDPVMSDLSIDASDLQADPAHKGLLILTATLRSRAGWPLAYPHLELTLTDSQDRVVVRRALAPADYIGGTTDLQRGIPPNGEVAVKLFIDASATTQAGYRLLIFYP